MESSSPPSLGSWCQWRSLPLLLTACPSNPKSETVSTTHVSGWLPLTVGSMRLGSILSHTTLQARLAPPSWPPSWCPSTHGCAGWVASAQLGSWPKTCRSARPMPRLLAAVLAEASEEAVAHRVSVGNVLSPIAVTIPITCLRPAVPQSWDVAHHGGQPSYKPLWPWDIV